MTERERLQSIKSLPSLIKYLRDELDWPIDREDVEDLFFEYEPEELGIDPKLGAQIKEIKQLRPLESRQPWGIFYINFEPKRLPIVVLRKILSSLVIKKRATAAKAERPAWQVSDLLFISSYGESGERAITFAHFSDQDRENTARIPTLRVLGWDDQDTVLHLDHVHITLRDKLRWPADGHDLDAWRATWSEAFILRPREVISTSRELALTLADLAKRIRQRAKLVLQVESTKGPLRKLHAAFKEALIHDLTEDDFADMYAQTIAYGLLAARISRPLGIVAQNLVDVIPTTNPFLRDMLGEFLSIGGRKGKLDFDELQIQDVIDLLNSPKTNIEAVVRDFGDRNPQEDPVIHFYELFLKEYDAKKRMQRGVFYTPRPVVSYIVRSVDELLRTEFGLKDGLADTTTWGEMANCGAGHETTGCGAGFQPAQAGMPAPQQIAASADPRLTAGSCVLKRADVARIVQDALLHFEGQRYHLAAWCIMPNHVHVVVQPVGEHLLHNILHSWKSFTASKINSLVDRTGSLWERESFDHLIRRLEHVEHFVRYTEDNPVAAGLCAKPGDWPFSSCGAGFQSAITDFVSPRESPFVQPRSRGELPHLHKEGGTYFITWRLLDAVIPKSTCGAGKDTCGAGFQPAQAGMPAPQIRIPEGVSPDQPFVQILDPATGTGTFLVEVIGVIHKTMDAKWKQQGKSEKEIHALWNEYVPKHLLPRLHGYELLMAPYAIAHLKIGLKLYETGYRFGSDERARVYLTNALEPASDIQLRTTTLPALAHEAQAVNEIKRKQRFTVVIGNPPYSGLSANMSPEAQRLIDAYKIVDGASLNERKLWLQDDYVKFIRKAQTNIDSTNVGVFGYITNHGYLDNPTFRGMRQSLMGTFPHLRVLDLHGNANKKEQSPDGSEDENVFDIRQGVAICLATRGGANATVAHTDLWGSRESKYAWLAKRRASDTNFSPLTPDSPFYFFEPQNTDCRAEYDAGWRISDAMTVNCAGFITARDHFVIALDKASLLERIEDFANLKLSDVEIRGRYFEGCGSAKYSDGDTRGWKVSEARKRVASDKKRCERVRTCLYRPFDPRPIYWADWMVDWPRPEVMRHMFVEHSLALSTSRSVEIGSFEHVFCTRLPLGHHTVSLKEVNYIFPLYLLPDDDTQHSMALRSESEPNFARAFLKAVSRALTIPQKGGHGLPIGLTPEDIFHYAYAAFHSPGYRSRYAEFLKSDFPRLPLTGNLNLFRELARLGGELVALHLMESPRLDHFITTFTGPKNPEVGRVGWSDDTVWLDAAATKKGQPAKPGTIGFRGVPEAVWDFHIGGYQVCEKWLKDRKGRTLTADDIAHYHKIVVALNETIGLMSEIDRVIESHGGWPGAFATGHRARPPDEVIQK